MTEISTVRENAPKRRGFFVRGLVVVLPGVLTIFVFATVVQFAGRYVAAPINGVIYTALDGNRWGWTVLQSLGIDPYDQRFLLPAEELPQELKDLSLELGFEDMRFAAKLSEYRERKATFLRDHRALGIDHDSLHAAVRQTVGPWAGILLAAGLVLSVGYLASGFLGRSAVAAFDGVLARLPLVRRVYPHAKQIVSFFLSDNHLEFDTVVAAPYPSPGIWSLGFVTSEGLRTLHETQEGDFLAVYIPSSPLPMTGYTIFVEAERLVPLDISVEEAFRTVVSAGVLIPPSQTVDGLQETMQRLGVPPGSGESARGGAPAGSGVPPEPGELDGGGP